MNRLPPPGLIDFSVGETDVVVVVVVVVDVSGALFPPPHAAVRPTMATIAEPPATAARRRAKLDFILCRCPNYPRVANAWSPANREAIPHASARLPENPRAVPQSQSEAGSGNANSTAMLSWAHKHCSYRVAADFPDLPA